MLDEQCTSSWSIMRYDLKTAIDVLGIPCHVQFADDTPFARETTNHVTQPQGGNIYAQKEKRVHNVHVERKICTCYIRARVIEIEDIDWFICRHGRDFVKQHARMVNCEILIPLACSTKARLRDKDGGKMYNTVREVAEDFPRFVRVEHDTVCASPGNTTCQIVRKGSILELDRLTKDARAVRGYRESYLICRDKQTSKELAFRLMSAVQFSKVVDDSVYLIKDLIERIPLPQVVNFLTTNPYDVISASDSDALDLILMLNGPIELQCLQMQEYLVGLTEDKQTVVAFPDGEEFLENILVKIPVTQTTECHSTNDITSAMSASDYETIMDKMYLCYANKWTTLYLRLGSPPIEPYDVSEDPDPPPLPVKMGNRILQHTLSSPAPDDDCSECHSKRDHGNKNIRRRRIVSTGDMESKVNDQHYAHESQKFRSYLSQFSRKMRMKASRFVFGVEAPTTISSRKQPDVEQTCMAVTNTSGSFRSHDGSQKEAGVAGFTCYIQMDASEASIRDADTDAQFNRRQIQAAAADTSTVWHIEMPFVSEAPTSDIKDNAVINDNLVSNAVGNIDAVSNIDLKQTCDTTYSVVKNLIKQYDDNDNVVSKAAISSKNDSSLSEGSPRTDHMGYSTVKCKRRVTDPGENTVSKQVADVNSSVASVHREGALIYTTLVFSESRDDSDVKPEVIYASVNRKTTKKGRQAAILCELCRNALMQTEDMPT